MLHRLISSVPLLLLGLSFWGGSEAWAASPETAPDELVEALATLEAAANAQAIDDVMAFYADNFSNTDGFNRSQFQQTLTEFWQQHPSITYDFDLTSWEPAPNGYIVETVTRVDGVRLQDERRWNFEAEVTSRQRFENGKIVSQEILSESSQLATGANPPSLLVRLPDQVAPSESYEFDAIVEEPLGTRSLLGVALDEGVTPTDFLKPRPLTLEVLSAGGLFKIGQADEQPDDRWVSAVVVREDGIVIKTTRLQIGDGE